MKIINGEQKTIEEWKKWRETILTASDVVKCIAPKKMEIGKQYINIARKIALAQFGIHDDLEDFDFKTQAMERGNRLEEEYGKNLDENWLKNYCISCIVDEVSLKKIDLEIGASFDFINFKDEKLIELKCPLSYNFLDEIENFSNEFIIQCKFQLYVLLKARDESFSGKVIVYHDKIGEIKKDVSLEQHDIDLFNDLCMKVSDEIILTKNKIASFL
mgnify:CR=1 FL=1